MSRTKLLSLLVTGLVIANIALALVILFRAPERPPHKMPREIIIEKLRFTDAQVIAYDELISWHRHEIRKMDEQILQLKNRLYSSISSKQTTNQNDSLMTEIGKAQVAVEKIHYKHFNDIRALCTPQQLPLFEELLKEIAAIFSKPKKEPHP